jgi:hypothetical protein
MLAVALRKAAGRGGALVGIIVETKSSSTPKPRVFYGWFVVAGTFAVTFVGFGCAYSFGAFLLPLQHDFAAYSMILPPRAVRYRSSFRSPAFCISGSG